MAVILSQYLNRTKIIPPHIAKLVTMIEVTKQQMLESFANILELQMMQKAESMMPAMVRNICSVVRPVDWQMMVLSLIVTIW